MNHKMDLKIAIIQHGPVFLNLNASLDQAEKYTKEAVKNGASLVVFPETWLPGYPIWVDVSGEVAKWGSKPAAALYRLVLENGLVIPSPAFARLTTLARKHKIYLVMGAQERAKRTIYNSQIFIAPDGSYAVHRKLMPTHGERLLWGKGDGSGIVTLDTPFGPLGGAICWEHWMPLLRAALHDRGEVIHVAQWPDIEDLYLLCSRHYAFEGQCFVLAAGTAMTKGELIEGVKSLKQKEAEAIALLKDMPGKDSDFVKRGGSAIIAPDARLLNEPVKNKGMILYGELDLREQLEAAYTIDTSGHYARPDIFELTIHEAARVNVRPSRT